MEQLLTFPVASSPPNSADKYYLSSLNEQEACSFITGLFEANGWIISPFIKNNALLFFGISSPKKPKNIIQVVRYRHSAIPLTFAEARADLSLLEKKAAPLFNAQQFCLISLSGFKKETLKLKRFNLLLHSQSEIDELIINADPNKVKEPRIQLFAHNQNTFEKVKKCFQINNSVAVVQATGTGKTFLIAKVLGIHKGKKLVMAPSNYILDQIKECVPWEKSTTLFITYAKGMYLSAAEIKSLNIKLVVLDEFHRCGADEWGRGVQNILETYAMCRVFGTSATPIRYMDKGRDMSDELFKRNVAENLSLTEAIVRSILPMPKYVSALYTLEEEISNLKNKIENSRKPIVDKDRLKNDLDLFKINWEKSSGIPAILKKHLNRTMSKFIVFCKDEEHLNEMEPIVTSWFRKAVKQKEIKTYRVSYSENQSDKNLQKFMEQSSAGNLQLLFSINMLNEGLHVNDVSGVLLLRPTESPNIFYQQIGRCLKVGLGQNPVIFDLVNNFNSIRSVDFINDIEFYRARENQRRAEAGLEELSVKINIVDEVKEITEVFNRLKFELDEWEEKYLELISYKSKKGHCNVPIPRNRNTSDKKELQLALWVAYNRSRYKSKGLPQDRIKRLDSIGFVWVLNEWSVWEDQFEKLIKFKERFGHLKVTQRWKEDPVFGKWVYRQRQNFKRGRMNSDHIQKLNSIGFGLSEKILPDIIWDKYFEELKKYKQNFGDCNVPVHWQGNRKLGRWVHGQRKNNKISRFLSVERIEKLNSLGFEWDLKYKLKDRWEKYFNALIEFKEKYGHTNVPNSRTGRNPYIQLGGWVSLQRTNYRRKTFLTPEKISRLEGIGFQWKVEDKNFFANYTLLKKISQQQDKKKIDGSDRKKLATWISNLRKSYKKNSLTENKIKLLEDIGFQWSGAKM